MGREVGKDGGKYHLGNVSLLLLRFSRRCEHAVLVFRVPDVSLFLFGNTKAMWRY